MTVPTQVATLPHGAPPNATPSSVLRTPLPVGKPQGNAGSTPAPSILRQLQPKFDAMTGRPINPYSPGKDSGTPTFSKNGTPILHLTSKDTTTLSIYKNDEVMEVVDEGRIDKVVGSLSTLYLNMHDLVIMLKPPQP